MEGHEGGRAGQQRAGRTAWRDVPAGPKAIVAAMYGKRFVEDAAEAAALASVLGERAESWLREQSVQGLVCKLDAGSKPLQNAMCLSVSDDEACAALENALAGNKHVRGLEFSFSFEDKRLAPALFGALAEGLKRNTALQALDLTDSNLGPEAAKALGSMLAENTTLGLLDLGENEDIGDLGCASITAGLQRNTTLRKLNLQSCGIGAKSAVGLGLVLSGNSALEELDVSFNDFSGSGARDITEALHGNTTLCKLRLYLCKLGVEACEALGAMLRANHSLQELVISDNEGLSDAGVSAIAQSLETNRSLVRLELASCELAKVEDAKALGSMLAANDVLEELDLMWSEFGDGGCIAIAEGLRNNKSLRKLWISGCSLGKASGLALGKMLAENVVLEDLSLRNESFGLDDSAAVALVEGLCHNRSLRRLLIEKCGQTAGVALGRMLEQNNSLKELNVAEGELGDVGGVAIAEGLQHNTSLLNIDMMYCSLGSMAAKALGSMLAKNTTLQTLAISTNEDMQDVGGVAIAEGLQHNTSLLDLNMSGCSLGNMAAKALGVMLANNTTLHALDIGNNEDIQDEGGEAIVVGLERNYALKDLRLFATSIDKSEEKLRLVAAAKEIEFGSVRLGSCRSS